MPKPNRKSFQVKEAGPLPVEHAPRLVSMTKSVDEPQRGTSRPSVEGVSIGVLLERPRDGLYLVEFSVSGANRQAQARLMNPGVPLRVGQKLVLAFEEGDQRKPVILGLLEDAPAAPSAVAAQEGTKAPLRVEASVDGRKVAVSAEDEIVFSCGKASITLTRAGKVIIRGEYLISRSTGVNCIRGGVVQIN